MKQYKLIDLTHTIDSNIPTWDLSCAYSYSTIIDYDDCKDRFKFRVQKFDISASAGTHIDAPSHCFKGNKNVSDIPMEQLISECVMIDVSDKIDENYQVNTRDIELFELGHGKISENSFVIFYTGWSKYWDNPQKYHNNYKFPTINEEVAKLLLERKIVGLGIDTLSPDNPNKGFFVHEIILGAGKFIVENIANANYMPHRGAYVSIMPLKLKDATECPVRIIGFI